MVKRKKSSKGAILTLDALVALVLVTILLIISTNYIINSKQDILPDLQLVRTGQDIVRLLDYTKTFDQMDSGEIFEAIDSLVPPTYEIMVNVTLESQSVQTGIVDYMPDDRFIGTGKRVIVTDDLKFGIVRFWIWSRD